MDDSTFARYLGFVFVVPVDVEARVTSLVAIHGGL